MTKAGVVLAACLLLARGGAAQLFVEHFSYNNGSLGSAGVGDGVWTGGDSANNAISVNSAAALTNSSLSGIAGSGVIFTGGTFKKKAAPFTSQTSGTVYCSFLLNIQAIGGTTKAFVYLQNGNSASSSPPLGIFLDSGSHLGIGKSVSSPGASTVSGLSAGTHFIVARYTFQGGNDQVDLWLDPASLGDNTNVPTATLTTGTSSSSDAAALSYIFLNHAVNQTLWVDEVRVGTTWADVTPTTGAPPPPPPAPGVLTITQALLDPAGMVLRGTGGSPTGNYLVVAATDLSTSVSNWPAIATNSFDLAGNFDCTNLVAPLEMQRFFAVHSIGPLPPPPVSPTITNQPQSVVVSDGNPASFTVAATGTAPLFYQWYFNTNSPVANATNSTLSLAIVSTNDAGVYSVVVSNSVGTAASNFATLTVNPANTNLDFGPIGFCNDGGTITGGEGGPTNIVTTGTELGLLTDSIGPRVILVSGSLQIVNMNTHIRSDKTIIGLGSGATLTGGGLYMHGGNGGTNAQNIIIRNLTIIGSTDDNIGMTSGANHIWIDHCTLMDASDGCMDYVKGSDSLTVSWCKFVYSSPALQHRLACLIGSSDDDAAFDTGKLHVTFHHNWWGASCDQRMPSVRFGRVHAFNNYYNPTGNLYCVRSRLFAECRIENNYFESAANPWEVYLTPAGGDTGKVYAAGNTLVNCTFTPASDPDEGLFSIIVPGTDSVFAPPYTYNLDAAIDVPSIVIENAGAGKGPFAP